MSTPFILREDHGSVAVLRLNRPELRNALVEFEDIEALCEAVLEADRDPRLRALVLTGAGRDFSAGGDIRQMRERSGFFGLPPIEMSEVYRRQIHRIPLTLEQTTIPIVAAVNGNALGLGCDLACVCDMRLAADDAKFGEVFVRAGIIPGDGGAWLLQRVVGYARALEMALTGDFVDAVEAHRIGLASRVVPRGALVEEAVATARRFELLSPEAVRMTKRLLRQAYRSSLADTLEMSALMQPLCHKTDNHIEAVTAILERRAPRFP